MRTISIYSDYKVGALSDEEYHNLCAIENRRERYIDDFERYAEEDDLVIDDEDYPLGYNPYQE